MRIDGDLLLDIPLCMLLKHADRSSEEIPANHSFYAGQIEWFKAGIVLNLIKEQARA